MNPLFDSALKLGIIKNVYVDADGVLADFDKKVGEIAGCHISTLPKGLMWKHVSRYIKDGGRFWYDLDKMSDADTLMSFLLGTGINIEILTAMGDMPSAYQDKIDWFAQYYPGVKVNIVKKSPDKAKFITGPTDILIDDRMKSIEPWVNAGGIGILHTSANDTISQLQRYL